MKKFIILSFFLSALMLTSAHAATNSQGDWKQRIMSEKIAFLTMEMGITPEEAQALLAEKDIDVSIEELVELKDIIIAKLQATENDETVELTEADLENIAGGTFGISVVIAIVGILVLCSGVTIVKTTNRW